jgi:hypothetical protein
MFKGTQLLCESLDAALPRAEELMGMRKRVFLQSLCVRIIFYSHILLQMDKEIVIAGVPCLHGVLLSFRK